MNTTYWWIPVLDIISIGLDSDKNSALITASGSVFVVVRWNYGQYLYNTISQNYSLPNRINGVLYIRTAAVLYL